MPTLPGLAGSSGSQSQHSSTADGSSIWLSFSSLAGLCDDLARQPVENWKIKSLGGKKENIGRTVGNDGASYPREHAGSKMTLPLLSKRWRPLCHSPNWMWLHYNWEGMIPLAGTGWIWVLVLPQITSYWINFLWVKSWQENFCVSSSSSIAKLFGHSRDSGWWDHLLANKNKEISGWCFALMKSALIRSLGLHPEQTSEVRETFRSCLLTSVSTGPL